MSRAALRDLFATSAAMDPAPEIPLKPEAGARFEMVDEGLAMARREGVTKPGFVGNRNFADAFRAARAANAGSLQRMPRQP